MPFGSLVTELKADLGPLDRALDQATRRLERFNRDAQRLAQIRLTQARGAGGVPPGGGPPGIRAGGFGRSEGDDRAAVRMARQRNADERVILRERIRNQRSAAREENAIRETQRIFREKQARDRQRQQREELRAASVFNRNQIAILRERVRAQRQAAAEIARAQAAEERSLRQRAGLLRGRLQDIGVRPIRTFGTDAEAVASLERQFSRASSAAGRLSRVLQNIGRRDLERMVQGARNFADTFRFVVGATIIGGLARIAQLGVGINIRYERYALTLQTILGITNQVVDSTGKIVGFAESFGFLRKEAQRLFFELRAEADKTILETDELLQVFSENLGNAIRAGLSLEEAKTLVSQIAQLAKTQGLQGGVRQLSQEVRAIFEGERLEAATVAKILGLDRETIQAAKEAGNFFELIQDRLEGGLPFIREFEKSTEAIFSTLLSKGRDFLRLSFEGTFDKITGGLRKFNQELTNQRVAEFADRVSTSLSNAYGAIVRFGQSDTFRAIQNLFKFIVNNADTLLKVFLAIQGLRLLNVGAAAIREIGLPGGRGVLGGALAGTAAGQTLSGATVGGGIAGLAGVAGRGISAVGRGFGTADALIAGGSLGAFTRAGAGAAGAGLLGAAIRPRSFAGARGLLGRELFAIGGQGTARLGLGSAVGLGSAAGIAGSGLLGIAIGRRINRELELSVLREEAENDKRLREVGKKFIDIEGKRTEDLEEELRKATSIRNQIEREAQELAKTTGVPVEDISRESRFRAIATIRRRLEEERTPEFQARRQELARLTGVPVESIGGPGVGIETFNLTREEAKQAEDQARRALQFGQRSALNRQLRGARAIARQAEVAGRLRAQELGVLELPEDFRVPVEVAEGRNIQVSLKQARDRLKKAEEDLRRFQIAESSESRREQFQLQAREDKARLEEERKKNAKIRAETLKQIADLRGDRIESLRQQAELSKAAAEEEVEDVELRADLIKAIEENLAKEINRIRRESARRAVEIIAEQTNNEIAQIRLSAIAQRENAQEEIRNARLRARAIEAINENEQRTISRLIRDRNREIQDLSEGGLETIKNASEERMRIEKEIRDLQKRTAKEQKDILRERVESERELTNTLREQQRTQEDISLSAERRRITQTAERRLGQLTGNVFQGTLEDVIFRQQQRQTARFGFGETGVGRDIARIQTQRQLRDIAALITGGDIEEAFGRIQQTGFRLRRGQRQELLGLTAGALGVEERGIGLERGREVEDERRRLEELDREVMKRREAIQEVSERQKELAESSRLAAEELRTNLSDSLRDSAKALRDFVTEIMDALEDIRVSRFPITPQNLQQAMIALQQAQSQVPVIQGLTGQVEATGIEDILQRGINISVNFEGQALSAISNESVRELTEVMAPGLANFIMKQARLSPVGGG